MKRKSVFAAAGIAAMLLAFSCTKEPVETTVPAGDGSEICMTVEASMPDGLTKVTNDGLHMVWEGGEKIGVYFGTESMGTGSSSYLAPKSLSSKDLGVFGGSIAAPSGYGVEDIIGICYPYNSKNYSRRHKTYGLRLVVYVEEEQVQKKEGVLNGEYFPMFAAVTKDDFEVEESTYTLKGKSFKWGCVPLCFSVFGKHEQMDADEVLKSVEVTASAAISGPTEYTVSDGSIVTNTKEKTIRTDLVEGCTIADRTEEDGAKIYMSIAARTSVTFTEVKITTNKAVYSKTVSQSCATAAGDLVKVKLNVASMERTALENPSVYQYSVDNGETWSSSIPETFTSLAVKGTGLDKGGVILISEKLAAQESAVDLDLSAVTYAETSFPAVFGNATSSKANKKLASIKLPSNVTEIEANAFYYCANLKSVDLTGIQVIGEAAFRSSGLTSLAVPSSVTSIAQYAFRYCRSLKDIYFNAKVTSETSGNHILSFQDSDIAEGVEEKSLKGTLTIGPDVTFVPQYFIRSNYNIAHVIFEGAPDLSTTVFKNCACLEDITCRTATPPADPTGASLVESAGIYVDGGLKKIYVPSGCTEAYKSVSPWSKFIQDADEELGYGYTIVEVTE